MKKILLLTTVAAMTVGSMNAQAPEIYPNEAFAGVSPNGNYAVSVIYETVTINDLAQGKTYEYEEGYYVGNGNVISNTGIIVGSSAENVALYWKDGEWHSLDVAGRLMSKADGITPDGKRIVGGASPDNYTGSYDGLMLTPCYWDVQADGTVGDIQFLPYPEKDWSDRTPQYITALSVSDDGKTIGGQIQDYAGIVCQPIVYHQDAEGKWEYTLIHNELYHPEGVEIPEYPGEWEGEDPTEESFLTEEEMAAYLAALEAHVEPIQPEYQDFMSEEEKAAYDAAMEKYYETWDYDDYPFYGDYMTEEEKAAYDAAMEAYYQANADYWENMPQAADFMSEEGKAAYEKAMAEYEEWNQKYWEWQEAFYELATSLPNMGFNNVILSHDGKTYATSRAQGDFFSGYTYTPYVFNLENDTYKVNEGQNLIITSMTADGTLLAQKPASWENPTAEACILPAGSNEFVSLYDYFVTANPDLAAWMEENLTHTVIDYDFDENWDLVPSGSHEIMATGIPFANADLSVIVLGVENSWDYENDPCVAYGYVLYTNYKSTSVNAVNTTTTGKTEYYTTDGRKVDAPVKGLNIVKTANGEIKKTVVK